MRKKIFTIIICVLMVVNVFAIDPNPYINGSKPGSTSTSKIITYIDGKKNAASGSVYCIGNDKIYYYESFLDEERDYYALPFYQHLYNNSSLSEYQKQINPVNLQMKYDHNPNYYDNAVSVSGVSGRWYDIKVVWDSEKSKWKLDDPSKQILFENPTDDKRGEWSISLKGTDSTGKPMFDKESIGFAKFYVHKAPVPLMNDPTYSGENVTLSDAGSYDIDYEIRKNKKQTYVENDRQYSGIKEFYWSAKIGENWVDVGKGPTVTFNKEAKLVTDYRLTVEDYDGAFASVSKSSPILEKPLVDFEFRVGGHEGITTNYVYKGNSGFEKLYVNPLIAWNDEAYNPAIYGVRSRTETWTDMQNTSTNIISGNVTLSSSLNKVFSTNILQNKFSSVSKNNLVDVELLASNRLLNYYGTARKQALVHPLQTKDLTGTEGTVSCTLHYDPVSTSKKPFMVGTNATFILDMTNPKVKLDEVSIKLNVPGLGVSNSELIGVGSKFKAVIPLSDVDTYNKYLWDQFNYEIKIYSKRTGEFLHNDSGIGYIHTPLNLQGLINDMRDEEIEINTDDPFKVSATTEKYAEIVTVKLPMDVVDVDTSKTIVAGTKINLIPNAAHTKWEKQLIVSSSSIEEDKKVNAEFEAIAYNKRDKETDSVGFTVISYRLENFRVVKVRDLRLESFYKNMGTGKYEDVPMFVDNMAIDPNSFYLYPISSLAKGYIFEFEIDSINFNGNNDTVFIQPSFYSVVGSYRDPQAKLAYWTDSNKKALDVGTGGHASYNTITLTRVNRTVTSPNRATWRGQYFIPGSTFLTNPGTSTLTAKSNDLKSDIIVNFNIEGLKGGIPKFNYNLKQWGKERTTNKFPYIIGDVIRYGTRSNLDDLQVNRTQ